MQAAPQVSKRKIWFPACGQCESIGFMRYPTYLLMALALTVTDARATSYGAKAAPTKPATSAAASAPEPAATPAPAPAAMPGAQPVPVTAPVDLFNGKDLSGWSYIVGGQPGDIATVCSVKDGVLVCAGTPSGYLVAADARENYQLHFEWRWTSTNPKTNSGGLLNISDGPLQQNLWPVCFQAQTKNQSAGDFIAMSTKLPPAKRPSKSSRPAKNRSVNGMPPMSSCAATPSNTPSTASRKTR
jgi:hypothetical protein